MTGFFVIQRPRRGRGIHLLVIKPVPYLQHFLHSSSLKRQPRGVKVAISLKVEKPLVINAKS